MMSIKSQKKELTSTIESFITKQKPTIKQSILSTSLYALRDDELIVDNFAGGGGASSGIEEALGRHIDIAINHDPDAIDMHRLNHPFTTHYCESIWNVDPVQACKGRPVGFSWFSPDCRHFSLAKGAKPVEQKIRGLAWVSVY